MGQQDIDPPSGTWRKSRACAAAGTCVEVMLTPEAVLVRDSKTLNDPALPVGGEPRIQLSHGAWQDLIDQLATGMVAASAGSVTASRADDGSGMIRAADTGVALAYTAAEWDAFIDGVRADEFAV